MKEFFPCIAAAYAHVDYNDKKGTLIVGWSVGMDNKISPLTVNGGKEYQFISVPGLGWYVVNRPGNFDTLRVAAIAIGNKVEDE